MVVGQSQPQAVFEIMGRAGELSAQQVLLRTHYSEGLTAYRARRWDEANNAFNMALETFPSDGPSLVLLSRVKSLRNNPPAADWDG